METTYERPFYCLRLSVPAIDSNKHERSARLSKDEAREIVASLANVIAVLRQNETSTKHIVTGLVSSIIMTTVNDPEIGLPFRFVRMR